MLRIGYTLGIAFLTVGPSQAKDLAPYDYEHFFDPSHLVQIDITIDEAHWDTLRFQHRSLLKTMRTDIPPSKQEKQFDYFPATMTIDGVDLGRVAIRKKGFVGSMDVRRPSFKVQIDRYDKKKSFAGIDTLTLNNNKQDPEGMNQVIGYQVFREAGLPAPHCNFAVVRLNEKSLGVYCNVESPDKRFARRHFGNDKGALYEGTIADFQENSLIRFERKFGSKKTDEKLMGVVEALSQKDDSLFEELGKRVDLDKFYRFWALECLLGHWDGYVSNSNNYFVYYNPVPELFYFVPWGMDQLAEDNNPFWGEFNSPKSVKAQGAVARRIYETEQGKEQYFATLRRLLETVWKVDELIAQIKQLGAMIEPHRVDFGPRHRQTGIELKKFIAGRRAELEAELKGEYPEWKLGEREQIPHVAKTGDLEVEFEFRMVDLGEERDKFFAVEGTAEVKLLLHGQEIDFGEAEIAVKQNRGWGRGSGGGPISIQITRSETKDGEPSTIEITFPKDNPNPERPVRIDVFASPGSGRLLSQNGNVGEEGTLGAMTGSLILREFGSKAGDTVHGTLNGELYGFGP